ncbi:MAG: hypothetical protein ACLFTI_11930 [Anaerolineales bacterium]
MPRYREEVLNVYLAELLRDRGIVSAPETITSSGERRSLPDVVVQYAGLRVILEGKVADTPNAHEKAFAAAERRLEQGIVQIAIALVYPIALREAEDVKSEMAAASFDIAIITESQTANYHRGDIDYLRSALTLAFNQLVQEDVVAEAVAALDAGIDRFASSIVHPSPIVQRLAGILGLSEPANLKDRHNHFVSTAHISGLVITNALIFQEILTNFNTQVWPLQKVELYDDILGAFVHHWATIMDDIDYYPIFHIAQELVANLTSHQDLAAFQALIDAARAIVRNKAALRHDLMGRVYHRLLADAKYLGTYYTSIPAATLLLRLALNAEDWDIAWRDLDAVAAFQVADLACGTGTLLMAAADALAHNYISVTAAAGEKLVLAEMHQVLVGSVIHGYDVLASAIHLTASTLAMRAPEMTFKKMNLVSLPLGGEDHHLGSIEFLREGQYVLEGFTDLFGAVSQGQRVTGAGTETIEVPTPPALDLCVMNPPFTRSVGGNLLFGSSPDAERQAMRKELRDLLRKQSIRASATAGLGAIFVAIGDKYLKPGGRIALVLPKALISGVAWGKTRDLFREDYQLETLIVSQDPEQWNFSESTSLSEVLLIARKNQPADATSDNGTEASPDDARVTAINLWRNPQTAYDALAVVQVLRQHTPPDIVDGQGAVSLWVGRQKVGEAIAYPWADLRQRENWMLPCAFAQGDLIRTAYHLLRGRLKLPGYSQSHAIPLTPLQRLGVLGPDRRDIYDGFDRVEHTTAYPAFWGHSADDVLTMAQSANCYLEPLSQPKNGRPLRRTEQLWPLAGRLLLAERLWLNTQRTPAVYLPRPVLSNVWWSFALREDVDGSAVSKVLALWLNSTLGLLILLASRDETRGAWIDFKKGSLQNFPLLDITALTDDQIATLAAVYDQFSHETLLPFPQMAADDARAQIDAAMASALYLPDLTTLRTLLAQEPVICLRQL